MRSRSSSTIGVAMDVPCPFQLSLGKWCVLYLFHRAVGVNRGLFWWGRMGGHDGKDARAAAGSPCNVAGFPTCATGGAYAFINLLVNILGAQERSPR